MSAALMYGNFSMCAARGWLILHLTPSCSGGVLFVLTRRALMQPVRLAACTGCLSAETSRRRAAASDRGCTASHAMFDNLALGCVESVSCFSIIPR